MFITVKKGYLDEPVTSIEYDGGDFATINGKPEYYCFGYVLNNLNGKLYACVDTLFLMKRDLRKNKMDNKTIKGMLSCDFKNKSVRLLGVFKKDDEQMFFHLPFGMKFIENQAVAYNCGFVYVALEPDENGEHEVLIPQLIGENEKKEWTPVVRWLEGEEKNMWFV